MTGRTDEDRCAPRRPLTIISLTSLSALDSSLDCFATLGEQTSVYLRERFQQNLPYSAVGDHVDKLVVNSMGSAWTRLYDSVCCNFGHISLTNPPNSLVSILFTIHPMSYQTFGLHPIPALNFYCSGGLHSINISYNRAYVHYTRSNHMSSANEQPGAKICKPLNISR